MKRTLSLVAILALAPLVSSCAAAVVAGAVGAGYIISQKVTPNNVHLAQVALDVDKVWPSVKETVGFYQDAGSEPTMQDLPTRQVLARVNGAKVTVEVEAIDMDRSQILVSAEKYLGKDDATAAKVMQGIVDHLNKLEK
jgi:2-methylaconitate cis-trans-isomerase PrpF